MRRMINWIWGQKDTEIVIDYRRTGDRMVPTRWTYSRFPVALRQALEAGALQVGNHDRDGGGPRPRGRRLRFSITVQPGTIVEERQYPNGPVRLDRSRPKR